MASECHYFLLLSMLIAGTCHATDDVLDLEMARSHEQWMAGVGRAYEDDAERARRFEIFKENVKFIQDFNGAGEHKYTLGLGPFTDLTAEEFAATYTGGFRAPDGVVVEAEEYSHRSLKYETATSPNIARSPFDWRTVGAVTPAKDQGLCGGCWAFAVAATIESVAYLTKGVLYNLSAQQLIDCDTNSHGCKGGWMGYAYEYTMRRPGLTTETNYPFTAADGPCRETKAALAVANITGYKFVPRFNEQALLAAVRRQPVAVAIDSNYIMQHYKSGVFDGPCGSKVHHAIVVVGYGEDDDGTKYWIIKNSWSNLWGEDGFMRMERNVTSRDGLCGIAIWPNYPTA